MKQTRQAIEPGTHVARATTLRIARATWVVLLWLRVHPPLRRGARRRRQLLREARARHRGRSQWRRLRDGAGRGDRSAPRGDRGRQLGRRAHRAVPAPMARPPRSSSIGCPPADGSFIPGQPRAVCYDTAGRLFVADNLDPLRRRARLPRTDRPAPEPARRGARPAARRHDRGRSRSACGTGRCSWPPAASRPASTASTRMGRWVGSLGRGREAPGQLSKITALAQAPERRDRRRLRRHRSRRAALRLHGPVHRRIRPPRDRPGNFSYPSGLVITGRRTHLDERRDCASACRSSMPPEPSWAWSARGASIPGSFFFPSGVATDGHDRLAVIERVGARLQVFRIVDAASAFSVPGGR